MIGEQAGRALSLLSGIVTCEEARGADSGFWGGLVGRIVVDLDAAGNEEGALLVADLLAEMWHRLVPRMTPVQEYELACARFEKAGERAVAARREADAGVQAAEAEYTAARHALAGFEVSPGIPRPEYDALRKEQPPAPDGMLVTAEERLIATRLRGMGLIQAGARVTAWTFPGPGSDWKWHLALSNGKSIASRHSMGDCAGSPGLKVSGTIPGNLRRPLGQWTVVEPDSEAAERTGDLAGEG